MFNIWKVQALLVTVQDIRQATQQNANVVNAWPKQVSEELLTYYSKRTTKLSAEYTCLLWGIFGGCPEEPATSSPAVTSCKPFWYISNEGNHLTVLVIYAKPIRPNLELCNSTLGFGKIYIGDKYIPVLRDQRMFLVIIDAHFKWSWEELMTSITSIKTITVLRSLFAHHGLPKQLVSDNRLQLTQKNLRKIWEIPERKLGQMQHTHIAISPSLQCLIGKARLDTEMFPEKQ